MANLFGAASKEISIVEFNHNNDKMVHTLQFESGLIVLINRLGRQSLPVRLDHIQKAYRLPHLAESIKSVYIVIDHPQAQWQGGWL